MKLLHPFKGAEPQNFDAESNASGILSYFAG